MITRERKNQLNREWHHRHRDENLRKMKEYQEKLPPWSYFLKNSITRAKKKGLEHDLTEEWFADNWTGKCQLTGIPFVKNYKVGPSPLSASVDRIDNSKGYTQDNCRLILNGLNSLKGQGSDDLMYVIAAALVSSKSAG